MPLPLKRAPCRTRYDEMDTANPAEWQLAPELGSVRMDGRSAQTADLLEEIGRRLALTGGNPYRARAYTRAAETLRSLTGARDSELIQPISRPDLDSPHSLSR